MKLAIFNSEYNNYAKSDHCRASKIITTNIKNYFINELTYNSAKYENRTFEAIFKIVYKKLSQPVSMGGAKVTRTGRGGACGMGQVACYDISIALIKATNSCMPVKIFLIKDKYKGPWNYVTEYLDLNPVKKNFKGSGYNNIYYIQRHLVLKQLKQLDTGQYHNYNKLKNYNCDELESYLCKCWRRRASLEVAKNKKPSKSELKKHIRIILKTADFESMSVKTVRKILEQIFDCELAHRKIEVTKLIKQCIHE